MRILVTGASGLIGGALVAWLLARGHAVVRLVRRATVAADEIAWDPAAGRLDPRALGGFDAVVHLAGANLADRRWTPARRRVLRESRTGPTRLLAEALAAASPPPRVLLSASAMGWYGDRGDQVLDETAAPGTGFLAELGRAWEDAAAPAATAGIRVVHPRTSLVLTPRGGALAPLLPLFRCGLGGPLGSGRQWWSWITLDDLLAAFLHVIEHDEVRGPFNAASPAPVTNRAFARALGGAMHRPALVPAPAFALRLVLGKGIADEALLASQRLQPAVLERTGFRFADPELEPALRRMLGSGSGGR